ncbi:MAG: CvpA family protein [Phycisphaeraceae bacterium]
MTVVINLILLCYLILMVYYWGLVQGLFSGFLHLLVTIAAGTLALALWEPLVLGVLIHRMPEYAWGVGLLAPFILFLIGLRVALDRLVRANVHFSSVVNGIVGGIFGLCAGILTAGLVIIGLGFLPLGDDIMGYTQLSVNEQGKVQRAASGQLWVAVDDHAAGFFGMLSGGAFYSGHPMPLYRGDLAQQAALFHLRGAYDPYTSVTAEPGTVSVSAVHTQPLNTLPGNIPDSLQTVLKGGSEPAGRMLVYIDTRWEDVEAARGTFIDHALNVIPPQVRLIAWRNVGGVDTATTYAPIAASVKESIDTQRTFIPFSNSTDFVRIAAPPGDIGFVFSIPLEDTPRVLLVRRLPLALEEQGKSAAVDPAKLSELLGRPPGTKALVTQGVDPSTLPPTGNGTVKPPQTGNGPDLGPLADRIELGSKLPRPISANVKGTLVTDGQEIVRGSEEVKQIAGMQMSAATRIEQFQVPGHLACIRLKIEKNEAQSLFGPAISSAQMLQPIWLDDNRGERNYPIGFVWLKTGDAQTISLDRNSTIRRAQDLPIRDMKDGDELYLYFMVPRGIKITAYNLGNTTKQAIDLDIPKQ